MHENVKTTAKANIYRLSLFHKQTHKINMKSISLDKSNGLVLRSNNLSRLHCEHFIHDILKINQIKNTISLPFLFCFPFHLLTKSNGAETGHLPNYHFITPFPCSV